MEIKTKKYKVKELIFVICFLLASPQICFAHGNLMILYSSVLLAVMSIAICMFFLISKKFAGFRFPVLGIYLGNVAATFLWWANYRGPDYTVSNIGLIGFPLVTFLCLMWLKDKIGEKKGE